MSPALARAAALVVGLTLVMAAVPLPFVFPGMHGYGSPHALWPLVWLYVLGAGAVVVMLAEVSRPVAALTAYVCARVLATWLLNPAGVTQRSVEVLGAFLAAVAAYWLIARWPDVLRWRWLIAIGLVHLGLGILDLYGVHPGRTRWRANAADWPTSLLGHPNHWGLFMAYLMPAVWQALSPQRAWVYGLLFAAGWMVVACSRSLVATAAALAVTALATGDILRAHRRYPQSTTLALAALGAVILVGLGLLTRGSITGGRAIAWLVAWRDASSWPWPYQVFGAGLGSWKLWAYWEHGPLRRGVPELGLLGQNAFVQWYETAHSDVVQHLFELGALGGLLGAWVLAQLIRDLLLRRVSRDASDYIVVAGLVGLVGSFPLHQPFLAIPLVLAAAHVRGRAPRGRHRAMATGGPRRIDRLLER